MIRRSTAKLSFSHQQEVDVIPERSSGEMLGFEIKASASVSASDFKSLKTLQLESGERFKHGAVLYNGAQIVPFADRLSAIPMTAQLT